MIGRRTTMAFARAATALVFASVPAIVSWALLAVRVASREAPPRSGSPNPAKAPISMLGPGDLLTDAVPYFAGTLHLWYSLSIIIVFGLIVWAVTTTARGEPPQTASLWPSWLRLSAISVGVGFVLATPWYYALFHNVH